MDPADEVDKLVGHGIGGKSCLPAGEGEADPDGKDDGLAEYGGEGLQDMGIIRDSEPRA